MSFGRTRTFTLAVSIVGIAASFSELQASPREVLIGVSTVGVPAASAAPRAEPDAAGRQYQSALSAARAGDIHSAQRQLEQLVAQFPESDSATAARAELAAIYNANSFGRQQSAQPVSGQIGRLGAPPIETTVVLPTVNPWRTTVKPAAGFSKSAQDDFRSTAGDLVFFAEGSADLGARARKALAQQAEWLKRHADRTAVIEGHADEPGSTADLKALSAARAQVVRARLIEDGVAPERIRAVAYGAERRVADCEDHTCSSQNRRTTTVVDNLTAAQLPTR